MSINITNEQKVILKEAVSGSTITWQAYLIKCIGIVHNEFVGANQQRLITNKQKLQSIANVTDKPFKEALDLVIARIEFMRLNPTIH